MKTVMVMDAQGGGLGRQLITGIKKEISDIHVIAVGTNSTATSAMLKAGADDAVTGENAVRVVSGKADVIIGPIGIIVADSMLGEITLLMASSVAQADAKRILIPFSNCDNYIAGTSSLNTSQLIEDALVHLKEYIAG